MNVQDVMTREVQSVAPSALLLEAARVMAERDVGFLPVVDNGVLVGVVTDRDLVERGVAEGCNPAQVPVGDVMSVEIVCCYAGQSTEDAKRLMLEHGLIRLPVIDDNHALLGVVTRSAIEGDTAPRKKSVHVTFQKEKTDSYGRPHQVPIKTVYITGKGSKEEAVEAAVKRFESEQKTQWDKAADRIEVENGPEGEGANQR